MGFTEAGTSIDKKGVVGLGWILGYGSRSSVSELVAGSNNKIFKGVVRIQVWAEEGPLSSSSLVGRSPYKGKRSSIIENIFYFISLAKEFLSAVIDEAGIMKRKPIFEIGIGDFDIEEIFFLADIGGWFKPSFVTILINSFLNRFEDLKPRINFFFYFHDNLQDFHRNFHSCGKPSSIADFFLRRPGHHSTVRRGFQVIS